MAASFSKVRKIQTARRLRTSFMSSHYKYVILVIILLFVVVVLVLKSKQLKALTFSSTMLKFIDVIIQTFQHRIPPNLSTLQLKNSSYFQTNKLTSIFLCFSKHLVQNANVRYSNEANSAEKSPFSCRTNLSWCWERRTLSVFTRVTDSPTST